ncbi:MAG TPA: ABC transporter substrate-binding protein [Acidimicrobiales bacterium]|nr:ABC transporter substrate-binding protein [Acidimicrobiales bacterium]
MANSFDRRTFLSYGARLGVGAGALGGASGLLAACGGGASTSSSSLPGENASGISNATPKPGGSLNVGVESEVNGFNPQSARFDPGGILYARTVFDPLAAYDLNGNVQPYLAQSITHNADYTQWTVTLRSGIKFHDGTALDANALKMNLDGLISSPLTGPALSNVKSTALSGPLSVTLSMYEPWVPFPVYLTGQLGFVAAPSMLNNPSGTNQPVGTGPFVFKEWVPNDHFTATKNPNYWRPGLPYLDQITFHPIPENSSRDNALLSGTMDLIHSSDPDTLVATRSRPGFAVITDANNTVGQPDMDFVMLNCAVAPTSNLKVRRALAYATNQQALINALADGLLQPSTGPFPPGNIYHDTTGYPSYDPAQARQLVQQAERELGGPISFELGTTNSSKSLQSIQLLQGMWQDVGIKTTLRQFEQTQFIANALVGHYQAYTWRQFAAPDPDINYVWWSISNAKPVGTSALNFARNKDQQVQAALDTGRTHTDQAVRIQAYKTVACRFGADCPYIWNDKTMWTVAARRGVENFNAGTTPSGVRLLPMTGGMFWLTQIWLSR